MFVTRVNLGNNVINYKKSLPKSYNNSLYSHLTYHNLSFGRQNPTLTQLQKGRIKDKTGKIFNRYSTAFFRDDVDWGDFAQYLKTNFPKIENADVKVYGCSTGEEAYTMAMVLKRIYNNDRIKIDAVDIDLDSVLAAKSMKLFGRLLTEKELMTITRMLGLRNSDEMREYMKPAIDSETKLSKNITRMVNFRHTNILTDLDNVSSEKPSIVMCRNMWPYIDSSTYDEYAQNLHEKLTDGSIVVIGSYDHEGEPEIKGSHEFPKALEKHGFIPIQRGKTYDIHAAYFDFDEFFKMPIVYEKKIIN